MLLINVAVSAQVPPPRVSATITMSSGPSPETLGSLTHRTRSPDAAPQPSSALFSQLAFAEHPGPPINAVSYLSMHVNVLSNGVVVCDVVGVVEVVGVVDVVGVVVVGVVDGDVVPVVEVVGVEVTVVVVSTAKTAPTSSPSITTVSPPCTTASIASAPSAVDTVIVTGHVLRARREHAGAACLPRRLQAGARDRRPRGDRAQSGERAARAAT